MANNKNQTPASAPFGAQPEQTKAPELLEIGQLRQKHNIPRAVFAGVCAAENWKSGKQVSEKTFLGAVKKFMGAPMGRRSRSEEGKVNA